MKFMNSFRLILFFTILSFFSTNLHSQSTYDKNKNVQFSLFAPLQVLEEDEDLYGIRFTALYGVNAAVVGFDFGVWSVTNGYQYGVQANVLTAYHAQDADGFSFAGIVNYTHKSSTGCIIGGFYNEIGHKITGFQTGLFCARATQVSGVQLSLFNYCEKLNGLQLGLINNKNNGTIPCTVLFNIGNSSKSR